MKGLEFKFDVTKETRAKLDKMFANFSVFTTRPDTIYGVSYTALSPEHPIVKYILEKELLPKNKLNAIKNIKKYLKKIEQYKKKRELI